jgi:hypothetical protein
LQETSSENNRKRLLHPERGTTQTDGVEWSPEDAKESEKSTEWELQQLEGMTNPSEH